VREYSRTHSSEDDGGRTVSRFRRIDEFFNYPALESACDTLRLTLVDRAARRVVALVDRPGFDVAWPLVDARGFEIVVGASTPSEIEEGETAAEGEVPDRVWLVQCKREKLSAGLPRPGAGHPRSLVLKEIVPLTDRKSARLHQPGTFPPR
jgi:hypothetical protein